MRSLLALLTLVPAAAAGVVAPVRAQGKPAPAPTVSSESHGTKVTRAVANGVIAMDSVRADSSRGDAELDEVGLRYAPTVRGCYEREGLRQDPSLGGLLEVTMTVLPGGTVREVSVDTSGVHGVGMSSVTTCVTHAAATWRFSPGPFGVERIGISFSLVPPAAVPAGQGTRTSAN